MIKKMSFLLCLSFTVLLCLSCKSKIREAQNQQCEHLVNPLGVDCLHPRLSWQLPSDENNAYQSGYRIRVNADSVQLQRGETEMWDSGKVFSNSTLVIYRGERLKPFTKYYWTITYWNQSGEESQPSAIASFETGMINSDNWQGSWISDDKGIDYKPAPYFRKEINLSKNIKSARIYIAAAGFYELSINGQRVSDELLNPTFTRFDRRNLYTSYDVTSLLREGGNALGVVLGNGWYNHQSTAVWFFDKAEWRNRPCFLLNLRVVYDDNSIEIISTDSTWKTTDGPIIFNSIYTAEHYDSRKEQSGWDEPKFDDRKWNRAIKRDAPSENIVSQQLFPVRVTDQLKPTKMVKVNNSHYVYYFEKNIAGIVKLSAEGKEGTELRIRHSELLDENGIPTMGNIDYHFRPTDDSDPFQTDIFVLSGKKKDTFYPRFNYKGFQYVDIISTSPIELSEKSIIALEMHSDVPKVGAIKSSNLTLNKIWEATNSSYLANLFGYSTDCPQREKNGWTGDGHIAIETALYNFDAITIYEKWMNDFRDEQKSNGVLPCIIPTSIWGYDWANGVDWTSAIAIIPWQVYMFYGDSRLLETMYDNIKLYVNYIDSISPEYTTDWGLGDWIPVKTKSNVELTTSLYYYNNVIILSKAAALFNKTDDVQYYTVLSDKIKKAINNKFLNKETGIYCNGSQTEQAAPLYWGIVPEDLKAKVAHNLYKKVEDAEFHLDVGLLGSKALLNALSENGYADAAYKVASQETYPSWGYWIVNGATTLHENWRIDVTIDASKNHIMFGEIGAWMYKGLGGIFPDEENPGFKHIILKPNFVENLESFEAKHFSPYGWIVSEWKQSADIITYNVTIPSNSTGTLYLPNNITEVETPIELKAGSYSFSFTKK